MMSPLEEVIRAIVLVVGAPVAYSFFISGWRIYKVSDSDYQQAQRMKKISFAVNLRTKTFVEVSTISDEAIDIILGAR